MYHSGHVRIYSEATISFFWLHANYWLDSTLWLEQGLWAGLRCCSLRARTIWAEGTRVNYSPYCPRTLRALDEILSFSIFLKQIKSLQSLKNIELSQNIWWSRLYYNIGRKVYDICLQIRKPETLHIIYIQRTVKVTVFLFCDIRMKNEFIYRWVWLKNNIWLESSRMKSVHRQIKTSDLK